MAAGFFSDKTIAFLTELVRNNNRDWFGENKHRYEEDVLDPALRFIQRMQEPIEEISPHFTAIPKRVGGSLMRIYRDTRFSKDKTPYKTNIGIQFRHEQAKDVHAPGYYVHIDPDQVFVGVGMWHPPSDALAAMRQRIADKPAEWLAAKGDRAFRRHFELAGDSLKRPPKGFSKDHPQIEDLRRKDFIAVKEFAVDSAIGGRFPTSVNKAFVAASPFMQFLCRAVGVRH